MCKKALPKMQAYVEQAAIWSKDLTRMRARGAGDIENAMRSLEREYGVDYSTLWSLRYRRERIKRIGVEFYMRLQAAYQAECHRQMRKLQNEIAVTRSDHVAEAQALIDQSISKVAAAQGEVTK